MGAEAPGRLTHPLPCLQAFYYPEEAGLAFGGAGSSRFLRLEVHYHNPLRMQGRHPAGRVQPCAVLPSDTPSPPGRAVSGRPWASAPPCSAAPSPAPCHGALRHVSPSCLSSAVCVPGRQWAPQPGPCHAGSAPHNPLSANVGRRGRGCGAVPGTSSRGERVLVSAGPNEAGAKAPPGPRSEQRFRESGGLARTIATSSVTQPCGGLGQAGPT